MIATQGYAVQSATTPLAPFSFDHRDPGPNDVLIDIEFCGVCHSDIHQARSEWGPSIYPMVPGHEIVGKVAAVGANVTKFKVGDVAAVGVAVDSCRECENCKELLEPYCVKGFVGTYNAKDYDGNITWGGYARQIVCDERFTYTLSPKLDPAAAAPLLCAGITTYSPLKHWKVGPGKKVGIVGLGGLGHMGLKFAHALGAHVVQFTTSQGKAEDAKKLGADEVVLTKAENWTEGHVGTFDFILDCVSAPHDFDAYLSLLKRDGTMCLVGLPDQPVSISPFSMIVNRRSFAGSMIGGTEETQQMLDFCAEHGIVSEIEITTAEKLEEAWERVVKGDVKYRFVLDCKTL